MATTPRYEHVLETVAPFAPRPRTQDPLVVWLSSLALGLGVGCLLAPTVERLVGGWLWLKADRGIRKADKRFDREYRLLIESTTYPFEGPAHERLG